MSKSNKIPVSGQIRRSQMITTFGPGAMIDLPLHSVIVGGLEHWTDQGRQQVHEKRLEASIARTLDLPNDVRVPMFSPPIDDENENSPRAGVTCFAFPAWFVAQLDGKIHSDHGRQAVPHPPARALARPRGRQQLPPRGQEGARRPGALRPGLSQRPYQRHRLVPLRARRRPTDPRAPLARRGRHRRRPRRHLHPLRGHRRAPSARRRQAHR
jgi:hypothetical protein